MVTISQEIDDFLTSNANNLVSAYSDTTTYAVGDDAREGTRIYRSIDDGNLGNYPPNSINTLWMDWDTSNEYAMLDLFDTSSTTFAGNGVVTFLRGAKEVIAIGEFKATQITIEYLDNIDTVLATETYDFPSIGDRVDQFTYIYAGFETSQSKAVYKPLKRLGTKIRVTFSRNTLDTSCASIVAGKATDLGCTIDKVNFINKTIGFDTKRVATFTTKVNKTELMKTISVGKDIKDVPLMFVIDPSVDSSHSNMVTIAKVTKCSGIGENATKNTISWELTQN